MGALIDLTGQKFNRLQVISKSPKRNASGQVYWNCLCECGKECVVCGTSLRSGHTKSCGCLNIETNIKKCESRIIDLTGQKFGKLTVIAREGKHIQKGGQAKTTWLCKCECGNTHIATGCGLKDGKIKSCGCLKTSYGEYLIERILIESNLFFEKEYQFSDCILPSGRPARFDFYVDNKFLIEFDGKQHFLKEAGWGEKDNLEKTQERDKFKNNYCLSKGIPLYRIPYTEEDNVHTFKDLIQDKFLVE